LVLGGNALMSRILIIDDNEECLSLLYIVLKTAGYDVAPLISGEKILEFIESFKPDLVITDIMMPGVTGGNIYEKIREEVDRELPVIISTGTKIQIKNRNDRFLAHCPKPLDSDKLLDLVKRFISRKRKRRRTP
jgi:DNA-binding NtrC family response regulator